MPDSVSFRQQPSAYSLWLVLLAPVLIGTGLAWQQLRTAGWWPLWLMVGVSCALLAFLKRVLSAFSGWKEYVPLLVANPLLMIGSYFFQTGYVSWSICWAMIPVGLLAAMIVYFQYVVWGRKSGKDVWITGTVLLLATSMALALCAIPMEIFPWYSVIAALTLPPVLLLVWRRERRAVGEAVLFSCTQVVSLIVVALWLRGWLGI